MCKPIKALLMPITYTFQITTRTFLYAILAIEDIIHLAVDGIHDMVACCMHFLQCCVAYLTCCCCFSKYGCKKYLYPALSYTYGFCFLMITTILVLFLIYIYTDWIEHLLINAGIKLPGILFYNDDAHSNKMTSLIRKVSKRMPATVDNAISKMDHSNDNLDVIRSYNLPTNDMVEYQNTLVDVMELYLSKSKSTVSNFVTCFNETSTLATIIHGDNIVNNSKSMNNLFKFNSYLNFYDTRGVTVLNSYNMKRFNEENVTDEGLLKQIPYFTNNKEKLADTQWDKYESFAKSKRNKKREEKHVKLNLYKNYTRGFTVTNSFKNINIVQENVTGKRLLTVICNFTRAEDTARLEIKNDNKDSDNTSIFDDLQKYGDSMNKKSEYKENQFYYNSI